ncbi:MAG TPA: C25 family cysteine peptidase [Bacteroidales bacterium]|nr:C25 family cysteine peptidase [Bacteroidales bacterium]
MSGKVIMGLSLMFLISIGSFAQRYSYTDSWGEQGFTLVEETPAGVVIRFSIQDFSMTDHLINGEEMKAIQLPGALLQNNEGAPNLPGRGKYIALPQGATAKIARLETRTVRFQDLNIAPAPRLPLVTDLPPLHFEKDNDIYSKNEFYPVQPVLLSPLQKVRGVDAVILGITPFQYNPVTRELIVIRDITVEVTFEGGNGQFGEDRYRSRTWDPILRDLFINQESLPVIDYESRLNDSRDYNWEYVIITPDNPAYINWADSLRKWRNAQGIRTGVVTLGQIGGNSASSIENYINDAYNNWPIPPSAFLLLGDYGTSGDKCIVSPIYDGYCISDNLYADVNGDHMPDVALARITANSLEQLNTMIGKMMDYELSPPTDPDFYDHPVSAGGWQSDRWFILCADVCLGFWQYGLGKEPVREYAGYGSGAPSSWSSNPNTGMVVDYFGPNGLGYIPQVPSHLTDWGGSATRINTDLNAGAFAIVHRDHGTESGWDSPSYLTSNLSGLVDNPLSFVFSLNCLTGKFNLGGDCFAEGFHKHASGALGIIAATEVSYSFVNDAYAWGLWDHMWPQFDPGYGLPATNSHWIQPCFANASAKYYLQASNWPYNPQDKPVTYYLFHHHGDAYMYVYSEVPQNLMVNHQEELAPGATTFTITATPGALVGLSVNGNYLSSSIATGSAQNLNIAPQPQGSIVKVVVTKQNYQRYDANIPVVGPPTQATSPIPGNHALKVAPFTSLHWSPGQLAGVDYFKIYLGTDNPPGNLLNGLMVTDTFLVLPAPLAFETLYNWRVDSYNVYGDTQGTLWDFTVEPPPDENFETGDFSSFDWYFEGNANWQTTTAQSRHGSYSARPGTVSAGQSSSLLVENQSESVFPVPVSFWVKTSTVEGANTLQFLIDGELKGEWSGETDWVKGQFTFVAGLHTFEWKYNKTQAEGSDQDVVWLDYIKFPPGSLPLSVNAGENVIQCAGNDQQLNGTATNYTSLLWTTSGDGSFNDPSILDALYTPGQGDLQSGMVTLTLTAFRNENSTSDDLVLTLQPAPAVSAGEPETICVNEVFECSTSSADNYQTLLWTTSGDGIFDDPTLLNPTYIPGPNDTAAGQAELLLTATGNEPCGEISGGLLLTINPLPEIPVTPVGPAEVDIYYNPVTVFSTEGAPNAQYYSWNIEPSEAGNFDSDNSNCVINWNPEFQGDVSIAVKGINECGEGSYSDLLEVVVYNTVGIGDQDHPGLKVNIVPNPSNGEFVIQFYAEKALTLDVLLTSPTGEIIFSEHNLHVSGPVNKTYDLSKQEEGVYFIQIRNNELLETRKIIILR